MKLKLLPLYEAMLASANCTVTSDGFVSVTLKEGDPPEPLTLKGKRIVLGTPEQLRTPDFEHRTVFHPLWEIITHGESKVLEKYRTALMVNINNKIAIIATHLLHLATETANHAKLNPDQSEYLSRVKMANEETYKRWLKIIDKIPPKEIPKWFVGIYLRHRGTVKGERYSRAGVVSFPFFEMLKDDPDSVLGVNLRKIDREAYRGLLDYLIPHQGTAEYYNKGSDSKIAPFTEVLMNTARGIIEPINETVELFRSVFGDELADSWLIPMEWAETFEDITPLHTEIRMTPMQAGNEGVPLGGPREEPTAAPTPAPAGSPFPVAAPQQPQPPAFAAAPQPNNAWGVGGYPQQQQQPQQQGAPRTASGKLDFGAFVRGNPAFAQQAAFQQQGFAAYHPAPAPQPPRASFSNQQAPVYGQAYQPQPMPIYGQPQTYQQQYQQPQVYGYAPQQQPMYGQPQGYRNTI